MNEWHQLVAMVTASSKRTVYMEDTVCARRLLHHFCFCELFSLQPIRRHTVPHQHDSDSLTFICNSQVACFFLISFVLINVKHHDGHDWLGGCMGGTKVSWVLISWWSNSHNRNSEIKTRTNQSARVCWPLLEHVQISERSCWLGSSPGMFTHQHWSQSHAVFLKRPN